MRRRGGRRALVAAVIASILGALASVGVRAAAASLQPGGVVLDGFGGLHPFGGFALSGTGAPYWSGFDIARALVLRDDGSGGWTLDGWGGVRAFGAAPPLPVSCGCALHTTTPAYWPGWDIARDLVITSRDADGLPDGRAGYVLDGWGGLHPWGGAPVLPNPYWPGSDIARGVVIHESPSGTPDGGWELLDDGTIVNFGAAPRIALANQQVPAVWEHLHANADGSMWALARWGVTAPVTGPPETDSWSGVADWGARDIIRDIQLSSGNSGSSPSQPLSAGAVGAYRNAYRPAGGLTLDGWGGLHAWGGFPANLAGAPYWPGWDIARAVVSREDGSGGWVLDGFGGLHAFGGAPPAADSIYWGWDIARAVVLTSHDIHGNLDGRQGYVLDGWGGIHPFGGAPVLPTSAYWPGWDIARGLDVHLNAAGVPDGLLVIDGFGGLHTSGAYPPVAPAPVAYPGHDVYERLGRTNDGQLYAVERFGAVTALGTQDVETSPWRGATKGLAPYWTGFSDWGHWDILRDVGIGRSDAVPAAQPVSYAAADELANRVVDLHTNTLPAPSVRMDMSLDCESAATSAALQTLGVPATQDWVFSKLPVDARPAVMAGGVPAQWGDAWTSFVGNVNGSENNFTGYGVYYPPLVNVAADAGRLALGGQGWTPEDLYAEIDRGHPVVLFINNSYEPVPVSYWTGWDGAQVPYTLGDHAVLLYGVNTSTLSVSIMDDETGTFRAFTMQQFAAFTSTYNGMAVVFY